MRQEEVPVGKNAPMISLETSEKPAANSGEHENGQTMVVCMYRQIYGVNYDNNINVHHAFIITQPL